MIEVALAIADEVDPASLPAESRIQGWVANALDGRRDQAVVDIRIVGEAEMRTLNRQYRGQDRPTNVLSFPADLPPGVELPLLGDLALCAAVIEREATDQGKALDHHWAHMVTHGVLHLLGHDHVEPADAEAMEALEREILARIGVDDPY